MDIRVLSRERQGIRGAGPLLVIDEAAGGGEETDHSEFNRYPDAIARYPLPILSAIFELGWVSFHHRAEFAGDFPQGRLWRRRRSRDAQSISRRLSRIAPLIRCFRVAPKSYLLGVIELMSRIEEDPGCRRERDLPARRASAGSHTRALRLPERAANVPGTSSSR